MSKRQMEVLVDDIDGTPILDESQGRTVPIEIDGRRIELDLTNDHIAELENTLSRFIGQAGISSNGSSPIRTNNSEDLQIIRDWARKNGYSVKDRGRIPFSVMDAFTKAHIASIRR